MSNGLGRVTQISSHVDSSATMQVKYVNYYYSGLSSKIASSYNASCHNAPENKTQELSCTGSRIKSALVEH